MRGKLNFIFPLMLAMLPNETQVLKKSFLFTFYKSRCLNISEGKMFMAEASCVFRLRLSFLSVLQKYNYYSLDELNFNRKTSFSQTVRNSVF